jgi:hypothetical protein
MALAASIEENKQLEERLKNADGDRWRPSAVPGTSPG